MIITFLSLYHYKSMGIFPDTQGQLTRKTLVGSCRISNSFEILLLFSLPARIVVVLGFYVPSTAKVIRRDLGLKSHPKDWRSPGSNSGPLVYKAGSLTARPRRLLPARMKNIRSNMKAQEWSQQFPHYKPMGATCICCRGNQSSEVIWP